MRINYSNIISSYGKMSASDSIVSVISSIMWITGKRGRIMKRFYKIHGMKRGLLLHRLGRALLFNIVLFLAFTITVYCIYA